MKKLNLISPLLVLLILSSLAMGSTTVPLNTGYNYLTWNLYPTTFNTNDNYWINIASYPATSPPVAPSFVLQPSGWAAPLGGSNWIGARNTRNSPPGTNASNPAYTIFRKCFCLLPGYHDARLIFSIRADDSVQVWLNTQLNQVLAPTPGHFNLGSAPLSAGTDKGFHVGKNCLYVLVEDTGGAMGFDLAGNVSADGLLPGAAAGTAQSFAPCSCGQPTDISSPATLNNSDIKSRAAADDDQQVINEIVKIAEERRLARQKMR